MAPSVINAAICGALLLLVGHTAIDITCVCLGIKYLAYTPQCSTGSTQDNFVWFATIYPGLQVLTTRSYEQDATLAAACRATCALVLGAVGAAIAVDGDDATGAGCAARNELLQLYGFGNLGIAVLALCVACALACHCKVDEEPADSYTQV
jgi:hypothetical protein